MRAAVNVNQACLTSAQRPIGGNVRVAMKEHRRRERHQILTRTDSINDIFTEGLAWTAVHQRGGTHLADLWQRMQPRGVLGGDVCRRPLHRSGRGGIEPFHIQLAEHCRVVIPHHASGTTFTQQGNDLVRLGVVANDVAGMPDSGTRGNGIDIGKYCLQRGEVGVNVANDRDLHSTLPATRAKPSEEPESPRSKQ